MEDDLESYNSRQPSPRPDSRQIAKKQTSRARPEANSSYDDRPIDREERVVFAKKSGSSSSMASARSSPQSTELLGAPSRVKSTPKIMSRKGSSRTTAVQNTPRTTELISWESFSGVQARATVARREGTSKPNAKTRPIQAIIEQSSNQARQLFPKTPSTSYRARITPARKTISPYDHITETPANRRRSIMTTTTPIHTPEVFAVKTIGPPAPFWHMADDDYQTRARSRKRSRNDDAFDFQQRVSISSSSKSVGRAGHTTNDRPQVYLGPNMELRRLGGDDDMDEDEPIPNTRAPVILQKGLKAARKKGWPNKPPSPEPMEDSEDESSSDSTNKDDDSGDSDKHSNTEVPETDEDSDDDIVEIFVPRPTQTQPRITYLASPPKLIKNLDASLPSEELITAMEAMSLSSIHMQKAKRLPFLRRNLRRGFYQRCQSLGIPCHSHVPPFPITVRYEHRTTPDIIDSFFVTRMEKFVCPLCELHGVFNTKETLESHLSWDHTEVKVKWAPVGAAGVWLLRLTISPVLRESEGGGQKTPVDLQQQSESLSTHTPASRDAPTLDTGKTLTRDSSSISSDAPSLDSSVVPGVISSIGLDLKEDPSLSPFPSVTLSPGPPPPTTRSPTPPQIKRPSESASRDGSIITTSTNTTSTSTATVTSASLRGTLPMRYPTPPPQDNPLGPAAQSPYLPAKSEYGGPDIYHSCRPGGSRLYDLLDTLPLDKYGVLAWDVLDREDEIYESDNVKDEHKVMHALWARWIVLNRNKFIANYYKGTIAFVDAYWRMIHRAAGWDALRYWLLMLLANRFLTGSEVAKVLKHYEHHTGMELWYD